MSLKLNDEQRKLVEQNHNLIYSAMRKFGIKEKDFDDYYGIAAIGLCKAAVDYDVTRTKSFSTYVYLCIQNEITLYNKWQFRQRRDIRKVVSYNQLLNDWDESDKEYSFLLNDDKNFEENSIFRLIFKDKSYIINNKDRMIIALKAQGYTIKEIGQAINISAPAVHKRLKKLRETTFSCL